MAGGNDRANASSAKARLDVLLVHNRDGRRGCPAALLDEDGHSDEAEEGREADGLRRRKKGAGGELQIPAAALWLWREAQAARSS